MPHLHRLAVITGASSLIGRAIAVALAELGYDVALIGQDPERLEGTRLACAATGVKAQTHLCDIASEAEVTSTVAKIRVSQGEPSVLTHAAGLFDWAAPEQADWATWARLVDVNLTATMRLTHMLLPGLTRPGGAVVLVGSGAGHQGFANNAAYVASKHGVVGFGRALFLDLRDKGTKVSVISPGLVAAGAALGIDPQWHSRFLRPEDVADAVRYVLSTSPRACPTEIILQPQQTPIGS